LSVAVFAVEARVIDEILKRKREEEYQKPIFEGGCHKTFYSRNLFITVVS